MNHPAVDALAGQVANTCRDLVAQPGLPFAEHLPEDQINKVLVAIGVIFRERIYTPAVTLWTFLTQVLDADHSCQIAVHRLLAFRVATELSPCSTDTGAYCKARARLPEELLHQLTRQTGRDLMAEAEQGWLWKGRQVKVVDGTTLSMPDTEENQKEYPQSRRIAAGIGFPLMRLAVVFSLAVGTVLDVAMGQQRGKGTGEVSLFRCLDDVLDPGDVLLGDRNFSGFFEVARAQAREADVVMRLHAGRKKEKFDGQRLANRKVGWRKPRRPSWMTAEEYESYPDWIKLRLVHVRVRVPGFRTKCYTVVTTLLYTSAYTTRDLAELYRRRWQAEINLRSLKTTLQMDILRGKSPDVVRKEVWAHLLVYNVVRTLMARAATAAGVRPDELSFAGSLQAFNAFLPNLRTARTEAEAARLLSALLVAIGENKVGNRPDRVEPRVVKRRPKSYPHLAEPRAEARQRLIDDAQRLMDDATPSEAGH
jgi:hypothetical protein